MRPLRTRHPYASQMSLVAGVPRVPRMRQAPRLPPVSSRGAGFLRAVFIPPFVCGAGHGALVIKLRARHSHNHFHFRLFRESISGSLSRRHLRQYCIQVPQRSLPRCGVEVRHVQPPSALSVTMNAAEFCCLSETVNTGCFSGDGTVEDTALLRTSNERRPPALYEFQRDGQQLYAVG